MFPSKIKLILTFLSLQVTQKHTQNIIHRKQKTAI